MTNFWGWVKSLGWGLKCWLISGDKHHCTCMYRMWPARSHWSLCIEIFSRAHMKWQMGNILHEASVFSPFSTVNPASTISLMSYCSRHLFWCYCFDSGWSRVHCALTKDTPTFTKNVNRRRHLVAAFGLCLEGGYLYQITEKDKFYFYSCYLSSSRSVLWKSLCACFQGDIVCTGRSYSPSIPDCLCPACALFTKKHYKLFMCRCIIR